MFGGRRPTGVPLVVESLSWEHGIFLGAALKSESTAAAEFKGVWVSQTGFDINVFDILSVQVLLSLVFVTFSSKNLKKNL